MIKQMYVIYDLAEKEFKLPVALDDVQVKNYVSELVNDVGSLYYTSPQDYELFYIGDFDTEKGILIDKLNSYRYCKFIDYVDEKRRHYQHMIQALNFVPQGYYKMPKEMQEDIKKDIDNAVSEYAKEIAESIDFEQQLKDVENKYILEIERLKNLIITSEPALS